MAEGKVNGKTTEAEIIVRWMAECCGTCRYKTVSEDSEHENGGGIPYCLYDGANNQLWQVCSHYKRMKG